MSRAGLTADRLTAAAADLADEIGLDAVTMTALAGRFDVPVASQYAHMRNAEDLPCGLWEAACTDSSPSSSAVGRTQ